MQSPGREPSMEDILASIKKVIAEEKELRTTVRGVDSVEDDPLSEESAAADDVLELDQPLAPPMDLGPPLVDEEIAGQSRQALEQLQTVAATVPPPSSVNPLEEIIRGHRVVRIFGGEAYERARAIDAANRLRLAMSKESSASAASFTARASKPASSRISFTTDS